MKKLLFAFVTVIMLTVTATPALACGSHHGGTGAASYSVCTTKNCTQSGLHTHNGKYYYAHYDGDGHTYHGYCDIASCTLTGYHEHDGAYCFGHTANDGHSYHQKNTGHH